MNVSLTPTLEKLVQDKVNSGLYNSASEVVREALRIMAKTDNLHLSKLDALRNELQFGIDQLEQGQFEEFDENSADRLLARIRTRRK